MRIGFDAKRLFYNFTGLGNYSRTLLKDLKAHHPDHSYHLYTSKLKETPETSLFIDNPSYPTFMPKGMFKSFWRTFSIVKQLKKDQIDLYHGLSNEIPVGIQKSGVKSVVTIHDLIFKVYPNTYPAFDRWMYEQKFKNSCLHADRVIAISKSTKQDIVDYYKIDPEKIDVVYQSCAPLYYSNRQVADPEQVLQKYHIPKEYLLCVGSIQERKNLKTIILAYKELGTAHKIPLVVVGKGKKYKEDMMDLVQELGIGHLVIWVENLDNNFHLKCLYQHAQALVYPSLYEGFGLPVAEALLCKTPAITSNVSSLPEAGGPHSLLIDPTNPSAIADAIQKVLDDSKLRQTMIEKGYEYAMANFTSKIAVDHTVDVYRKTLGF